MFLSFYYFKSQQGTWLLVSAKEEYAVSKVENYVLDLWSTQPSFLQTDRITVSGSTKRTLAHDKRYKRLKLISAILIAS